MHRPPLASWAWFSLAANCHSNAGSVTSRLQYGRKNIFIFGQSGFDGFQLPGVFSALGMWDDVDIRIGVGFFRDCLEGREVGKPGHGGRRIAFFD